MAPLDEYLVDQDYAEGNKPSSLCNITIPSGLQNTLLLALITGRSTWTSPRNITDVKWQGVSMSATPGHSQYDYNNEGEWYIFSLMSPAAGTGGVSFTYNSSGGDHDTLCALIALKNIHQTLGDYAYSGSGSGTSRTISGISCGQGDFIFMLSGLAGTNHSPETYGTDQVKLYFDTYSGVQASTHMSSYKLAASTSESVTHSWTNTADNGAGYIVVRPIMASSGMPIWWFFERSKRFFEDLRRGTIPMDDLERRYQEVMI